MINPKYIDRAVEVWIQMLENPKYDNLGPSRYTEPPESRARNELCSVMAEMLPRNNTPDVLLRFGEELRKILDKQPRDTCTLSVDYGPDLLLSEAAKAAGLDMQFPWKTVMWIRPEGIIVRYGYGAPRVYHYPTANGWFVSDKEIEPSKTA